MCEPVSIAMAVTAVAGAASQASAARGSARTAQGNAERLAINRDDKFKQAVAQLQKVSDWQHETYARTRASLQNSLTGQYTAMLDRARQQRDQTFEQATQYAASADQATAQMRTAVAGQTTGNSVLLAQQAYEVAALRQKQTIFKNMDAQIRQGQRQMLAMQAQSQSQLNQAMPAPLNPIDPVTPVSQVHNPSMMPYFIQGASGIIGAASHYQSIQPGAAPAAAASSGPINYEPIAAPSNQGGWA